MTTHTNKRKRTDIDDLFASSDEESGTATSYNTDVPTLDATLKEKYPGMEAVHNRFFALMNTFQYVYCVTMNFESLISKKKKDAPPVHMLAPYRAMTNGKLSQAKMEPDHFNDRVYHKDVVRAGVKITQFAYNKKVHDRINQVGTVLYEGRLCINKFVLCLMYIYCLYFQVNTAMDNEFKACMGMLKIPDCLKFIVHHGGHYHIVIMSNISIYSRNAYKSAIGETFKRRVASSKQNTKAAGQLDAFLHMMYLLSGEKQIIGMSGEKDEQLKEIVRDMMGLRP